MQNDVAVTQNKRSVLWIFWLLVALVAVTGLTAIFVRRQSESSVTITPRRFQQLKNGMTYEQITQIAGAPVYPKNARPPSDSKTEQVYSWGNSEGGGFQVGFIHKRAAWINEYGIVTFN